jgi:hypothetical protein
MVKVLCIAVGIILGIAATVIVACTFLSCWYSIPYDEWAAYEKDKAKRKLKKQEKRGKRDAR